MLNIASEKQFPGLDDSHTIICNDNITHSNDTNPETDTSQLDDAVDMQSDGDLDSQSDGVSAEDADIDSDKWKEPTKPTKTTKHFRTYLQY